MKWSVITRWGERAESVSEFSERMVAFLRELPRAGMILDGPWADENGGEVVLTDPKSVARWAAGSPMRDDVGAPYPDRYAPTARSGDWSSSDASLQVSLSASFKDRLSTDAPLTEYVIVSVEGSAAAELFADPAALVRVAARAWRPDEVHVEEQSYSLARARRIRRTPSLRSIPMVGIASWFSSSVIDGCIPGDPLGDGFLYTAGGSVDELLDAWLRLGESGVRRRPVEPQRSRPAV